MRNVLIFIASVADGAAASARRGRLRHDAHAWHSEYVREFQIWWGGNWLGSLCIAPIVMGWAVRFRARQHSAPRGARCGNDADRVRDAGHDQLGVFRAAGRRHHHP